MVSRLLLLALVACGSGPATTPDPRTPARDADPDGPHRAAVAAQVTPYLEGEIVSGLVVGLYDGGKLEIYGFGKGPGGAAPTGRSLFEIGSVTKVYTGLLLADAVQRREVELDTPVAELMPVGVTIPTRDKVAITLRHLALHSSGLPRLPPSVDPAAADPYGRYDEEVLYRDLIRTGLEEAPGTQIVYSNYGAGLLGFALGRKVGGGYASVLQTRVLTPLELRDTYITVPAAAAARRAPGTNDDLQPTPHWTWTDALGGAGAVVSTARDQLRLIEVQLDAAAGSKTTLRAAMRLTQESQLEETTADNQGLGWMIDSRGRYLHNGGTTGSRSYVSFDPKTRRGVVVLASTGSSLVDRLGPILFDVLDKLEKPPAALPTAAQLASYVGSYDLAGTKLVVSTAPKRLYLEGPGEPRHRLVPLTENAFWVEALQSIAVFQKDGDKVARVSFSIGGRQLVAPRVE